MSVKSPVTIVDVAREAGVSTATVSRAISGAGPVSEAAEARVRAAIAELKYAPIRRRRSGAAPAETDGVSASTRPIAFLRLGPFDPRKVHTMTDAVIEGLDRTTRALGRTLSVCHVPDLEQVEARQVIGDAEGAVIRTSNNREMIEQAIEWLDGIPAVRVLGENRTGRTLIDHVTPDNAEVGALAAEYLIKSGCSHLVFTSTAAGSSVASERCVSFVKTAGEAHVPVSVVVLSGEAGIDRLTQELEGLPADLKAVADRLELVRTVAAIEDGEFGLFMPRDFELAMVMPQLQVMVADFNHRAIAIGCDNESRCLMELDPRPATIDLHVEDVAARAIRRLSYRIAHPNEPRVRITVAPDIVVPVARATAG